MDSRDRTSSMRRIVAIVAALNLIACVVEGVIAWRIGSVALFADAADFLEDFLINTLVLVAAGWPLASPRKASYALAGLILLPALAALWTAIHRILEGGTPHPLVLGATGAGHRDGSGDRGGQCRGRGGGVPGGPRGASRAGARAR